MLEALLAPLAYGFMQRGLAASLIVGVLCSVMGCWIVLRGMAFLGDALAHAILPGVAVAYLAGFDMFWGGLAAAVLVALGVGRISRRGVLKEDTAIGILFAAALALGVALMSSVRTFSTDLVHVLFGDLLGISPQTLALVGILSAVVLAVVLLCYRPFLVLSFDAVLAKTLRLNTRFFNGLLLVLLAFTVVLSLQTVGVGLAAALLVTPAATARLVTRRLPAMMAVAALIGAVSGVAGLYASYYLSLSSGAAVVLVATLIFLVVFGVTSVRRRRVTVKSGS